MTQIIDLAHYQELLDSWVAALEGERNHLGEYLMQLQLTYPSWRANVGFVGQHTIQHDPRPEYFMLLAAILQNVWLSFIHMRDQLCDGEYWRRVEPGFATEQEVMEALGGYQTMVMQYSIAQTVSITETTLTAIATSGDGPFNMTTSAGFYSVYMYVLNKVSLSEKYETLFDILRLVRNTNHTNGVFLPRRGGDSVQMYRGKGYNFKVGQQVPWYADDMITSLFVWMRDAMWEIVTSSQVQGITSVQPPEPQP